MVAALGLTIGGARQVVAVTATDRSADPDFLNAWSAAMLSVLAVALLTLIGSIVGLVVSNRRVVRELTTDPLTGLRNRRALIDELARVCQRASEEQPAFLWFFDLNGFKTYNDSFGHVAGDSLLERLGADCARPSARTAPCTGSGETSSACSSPPASPTRTPSSSRPARRSANGAARSPSPQPPERSRSPAKPATRRRRCA